MHSSTAISTSVLVARPEVLAGSMELCAPVRRIVALCPGSLRELLFCLPALRALRETFESANISVVARAGLVPLVQDSTLVDEVLPRPEGGLSAQAQLMARLHSQHCDLALAFSTSRKSTLLAWSSGASVRLGFDDAKMDALLTHRIRRESSTPFTIEDYLELARLAGCAPRCHDYSELLQLNPQSEREAAHWLQEHGLNQEFFVLAPPMAGNMKRALRRDNDDMEWARLIALLSARAPIVLCGDRPHRTLLSSAREMQNKSTALFDAGGALELPALAALLGRSRLLIGQSSGLTHLAAAMSTPVVALRSPLKNQEHEDLWREVDEVRGVPHRLLQHDASPETIAQAARELVGL